MNNFIVYNVALDLVRALRPVVAELRGHSSDLADQLERAATSLVLNLGEGNRRAGKDRRRFFGYAQGSASEIKAVLDVAKAWGWQVSGVVAIDALLDRERALLWRLIHPRQEQRSIGAS